MIRRTTWILLATFVVLAAGLYLWQQGVETSDATATPTPQVFVLPGINSTDIQSLVYERAGGERLVLEKTTDAGWLLTDDANQNVNEANMENVLRQLSDLTALSSLAEPPAAEVIGLSPPAYTIHIRDRQGSEAVLQIGDETPTASGYYVQVERQVYVVAKFAVDTLLKPLTDPQYLAPPTATPNPTFAPEATPTAANE